MSETRDPKEGMKPAEVASGPPLRFYSADDLLDSTPERPNWVLDGYLAEGIIAVLAGPPKRAGGKSTFTWALVRAMLEGRTSFVGRLLVPGPVVYLSEEPAVTLRPKVAALRGLPLSVVWREAAPRPKPSWADSIAQAADECERVGARLFVVDTFAEWAHLKADAEKDSGAVQAAMEALTDAVSRRLSALLIHHHRKGGGENGEAIRGSSALLGAVDVAIDLTRIPGEEDADHSSRQRMLNASSRWPDTPESMIVELLADGRYALVSEGQRDEVKRQAVAARILPVLPVEDDGLTAAETAEAMGITRQRVGQELPGLVLAGKVRRTGIGKRGDPYRYLQAVSANGHLQKLAETGERGLEFVQASPPVGGACTNTNAQGRKGVSANDSDACRNEHESDRWRDIVALGTDTDRLIGGES